MRPSGPPLRSPSVRCFSLRRGNVVVIVMLHILGVSGYLTRLVVRTSPETESPCFAAAWVLQLFASHRRSPDGRGENADGDWQWGCQYGPAEGPRVQVVDHVLSDTGCPIRR